MYLPFLKNTKKKTKVGYKESNVALYPFQISTKISSFSLRIEESTFCVELFHSLCIFM